MTRPATSLALAALVAAGLVLGACSGGEGADRAAAPPAAPAPEAPPPPPPADTPTVGGDGSEIRLSALTPQDIEAATLPGELACVFGAPKATLLLARGNVASRDPAIGVVKVGDYVDRVAAPGGFDGMLNGAVFSGRGKTIRIALTGPATGGGESPPRPATLTYQRADGAERVFAGTWTCGP